MTNRPHTAETSLQGQVLLVEDDELFGDLLKTKLARAGVTCDRAATFPEGKKALDSRIYHTLVVDMFLRSDKPVGLDLIKIAKQAGIPSVIITSQLDLAIAKTGLNNGADYLLEKPFEIQDLLKILNEIWENPRGLVARRERFLENQKLTEKEKELARLMLKGLTNQEIAEISNTTLATVKFYTNQIFEKCEVSGRSELFNVLFPT